MHPPPHCFVSCGSRSFCIDLPLEPSGFLTVCFPFLLAPRVAVLPLAMDISVFEDEGQALEYKTKSKIVDNRFRTSCDSNTTFLCMGPLTITEKLVQNIALRRRVSGGPL